MSADGYFRIPRRLATAQISAERVAALLWIVSQASYAPREVAGVTLDVGETPPIAASEFEKRYRWTRKAVRVFLEYAVSDRCAEETGVRLKVGRSSKGPSQGPGLGPSQGPTYVVRLHKVSQAEGPSQGPGLGPSQGPTVKKTVEVSTYSPLRGESREGGSENGTATRKRAVPKPLGEDWQPTDKHAADCLTSGIDLAALVDDFRFYWTSINGTKANWDLAFSKRIASVRSTGQFRVNGRNGKQAPPAVNGYQEAPPEVALDLMERLRG